MKKIILIQHEPITERLIKIFCINEIINNGFYFEYWDISNICNPGMKLANQIEKDYVKKIQNYKDLCSEIDKQTVSDTILIIEIHYYFQNRKIWKLLNKNNFIKIKFERYGNTELSISYKEKLFNIIFNINFPSKLKNYLLKKLFEIYCKILNIKQYDYLITSVNQLCDCKVNHPDYDLYLEKKSERAILSEKYIVFIDTGFGKHPDDLYAKGRILKNDNFLWQNKLCTFFDFIEKKYNLPVVIAVHPKIDYKPEEFGNRKKIKFETLNLVLNAEYVLQDISNSISFSIINNNKIGFITTKEFLSCNGKYLNKLAISLNQKIFCVDSDNFEKFKFNEINQEIRNNYIYSFLTSKENENEFTNKKFIQFIKSL